MKVNQGFQAAEYNIVAATALIMGEFMIIIIFPIQSFTSCGK